MKRSETFKTIILVNILIFSGLIVFAGENKTEKIIPVPKKLNVQSGIVISKFKSGNYIYVEFKDKKEVKWAAAYAVVAAKGDLIEFRNPMEMRDFYSKSLKRKFKTIYFAGVINAVDPNSKKQKSGKIPGKMSPDMKKKADLITMVKPGSVKKAAGGYTVAECFNLRSKLKNEIVTVRGIVVKVSSKILGKNWIHIQDGSGKPGENDITVTTGSNIKNGDIILVKGKINYQKSIGQGYIFPAIIEDAEIFVQQEKNSGEK